jgi:predicted nucleotide-binding protein (sugar kinase/HSP70/actin superfamily)
MKIGLPRAFLYYRYHVMWRSFFEELGCEVIESPETNKAILDTGLNCSIDENCLSAKIYMGHVQWLIGKCDYILCPRVASYEDGDLTCTKFFGIYDVVRTSFPSAKLLHYNVDYKRKHTEWMAYKKIGKELRAKGADIKTAYSKALQAKEDYNKERERGQEKLLESEKLKVLIVSHPYNIYDKLVGEPIVKGLQALAADVLYADVPESAMLCRLSREISKTMYWRYNKEITGAVEYYKKNIDGIVFLVSFPCGPDALMVDLITRKVKGIPMTSLLVDANFGEAGLQTRIESFIDIIQARKKEKFYAV